MTPEEQAQALSRWLESPAGTHPPGELDPDVVESVYSLRPDLAPAPRVSADDILASLTAGPLADPDAVPAAPEIDEDSEGGEVVAFPTAEVPIAVAAAAPRRNWWRAANQWGGISAIVATAATLAVIALPVLQMADEDAGPASPGSQVVEEAEMADEAPSVAANEQAKDQSRDRAAAAPPAEVAAGPSRPAKTAERQIENIVGGKAGAEAEDLDAVADLGELGYAEAEGDDYLDMGGADEMDEAAAIIPEAQAAAQQPTYAGEPAKYDVAGLEDIPEFEGETANTGTLTRGAAKKQSRREDKGKDELVDLTGLRAQAHPGSVGTSWRNDLDGGSLAEIDGAIAAASAAARSGNYTEAGDIMSEHIATPATSGQAQAVAAADYYLRGNNPGAALNAASRGLALSSSKTASRAMLEVLYGDALQRTGDYKPAEAAYQRAIEINAKR